MPAVRLASTPTGRDRATRLALNHEGVATDGELVVGTRVGDLARPHLERCGLDVRGGLLGSGDAVGPDQLGGVDLGEAHDGDALGIGSRGIDGVVENAGSDLRAIDGGGVEGLVLAAGGDLAEDRAGLKGLAGEHGDAMVELRDIGEEPSARAAGFRARMCAAQARASTCADAAPHPAPSMA
jgi:hypothetical protein